MAALGALIGTHHREESGVKPYPRPPPPPPPAPPPARSHPPEKKAFNISLCSVLPLPLRVTSAS